MIDEPGYMYIWLSNENATPVEVYFDDFKVTQQHSTIVAGSDYYPFGLTMSDRDITQESYRYGYQGQYSEEDETTGWNNFELRMYDPRFCRWVSPDPFGEFDSPYVGMGNNPVSNTDPDGGLINPGPGFNLWRWIKDLFRGGGKGNPKIGNFLRTRAPKYAGAKAAKAAATGGRQISGFERAVTSMGNAVSRTFDRATGQVNAVNHTLTLGLVPLMDPESAENPDAFKSGQDFGQEITGPAFQLMMSGSASSPTGGSTPVFVTPNGNLPVTKPVAIPLTNAKDVHGQLNAGTQTNSKTIWKGKGKERIDVENPNPSQRPGQIHYQDNVGNKYIYDPVTGKFRNAPRSVNDLLSDPNVQAAIVKGLRYLGIE